jgi:hypothetical protein
MSICNPYRHAKRKNDTEKLQLLKERMEGLRVKYSKDTAVFDLQAATIFHAKGISL